MRFYTQKHKHYCGVDLHARTMYVCVLDADGEKLVHRNLKCDPHQFLRVIAPYREDLVVAVECMFCWYWLADLCADEGITFVLAHALYMKAVHGGKAKNDRLDALKIATLLRGGVVPQSYVYPREWRSTRDLLRRRTRFVRKRAELMAHIHNTTSQYCLPKIGARLAYRGNRDGVAEHFEDPAVSMSMAANLSLLQHYDEVIHDLELFLERSIKVHDKNGFYLLRSIPGVGKILALTILYEIHDIARFEKVGDFVSYARLVKCAHESAGKRKGSGGAKIGNAHLKWAYSEAAVLFLRGNDAAAKLKARIEKRHGPGKALSILAHKLGRASYFMMKQRVPFDEQRFLSS